MEACVGMVWCLKQDTARCNLTNDFFHDIYVSAKSQTLRKHGKYLLVFGKAAVINSTFLWDCTGQFRKIKVLRYPHS